MVDGPPPPVAPAVITRDDKGNATMRAVRIDKPLKIDGRLDEDVYRSVPAAGGFIMQEPREGEQATEQTDTWVFFDSENLYIAARCWDDHPERWVVTELRHDNGNIIENENLSVSLDTFHDRRNGFMFQTNPLGALRDMTVTDDQQNSAWNGIWFVKTGRFEHGWTMEVAIPFKTLRYAGSGPQTWGINLRRLVKWKNEISYLSLVPAALGTMDIRPNTLSIAEGFTTLREAARIESFQPHMHLRGKAMMVEAILPTGQKQVISMVSDFNFNWMTTYVYADDAAPLLPKGTILKVTAWHDNTTAKKSNPDPNQWVGWGDRTVDEMAHAWINIVYMKDEDFKIEQDKRRATATPTTLQQQ